MNTKLQSDTITYSEEETLRFGATLAGSLKPGSVVCLHGGLGAGKTHLVKGIVSALGFPAGKVNSPTFTIVNEYRASLPVYHFDAYRIERDEELLELGVEEYLYGQGVCLIEWPEKMETFIPANAVHITIQKLGESIRSFAISETSKPEYPDKNS